MKTRKHIGMVALIAALYGISCTGSDAVDNVDAAILSDTAKYTQIQWLDSVVNFGTINMGEKIQVVFRFKNTGKNPLFLANVRAGCGCTVPDYTKGAIAPGGEGVVTGAFDSNKAHAGEVRKSIFVTTNTHNQTRYTLIFTGLIKEVAK
ncbi:MAG: DUF1573 domain-containing protein [Bacteroidota bacterium]